MAENAHLWEIVLYELSRDRQTVLINEVCKYCGQRHTYERPTKRQVTN